MNWNEIPEINLYSDGGAEPNPGKGGFGIILSYKETKKEFSQGYRLTTNNRMELMGVIYGLERLKTKAIVNVYSDSKYVVNGITNGWAAKWKSNNWYRTKEELASNHDLWDKLLLLISNHEEVRFNWIRGHAGHPENERCDELAFQALYGENLLEDSVYEEELYNNTGYEYSPSSFPIDYRRKEYKKEKRIKAEGDPCRKCGCAVIFRPTKKKELKPGQTYYFEYFLICPKCKTVYMIEDAKRFI